MNSPSPEKTPAQERCQYRAPAGRRCALHILDPRSNLCPRHASAQIPDSQDFSSLILKDAGDFDDPGEIKYAWPPSSSSSPADASPPAAPRPSPTSPASCSAPCATATLREPKSTSFASSHALSSMPATTILRTRRAGPDQIITFHNRPTHNNRKHLNPAPQLLRRKRLRAL